MNYFIKTIFIITSFTLSLNAFLMERLEWLDEDINWKSSDPKEALKKVVDSFSHDKYINDKIIPKLLAAKDVKELRKILDNEIKSITPSKISRENIGEFEKLPDELILEIAKDSINQNEKDPIKAMRPVLGLLSTSNYFNTNIKNSLYKSKDTQELLKNFEKAIAVVKINNYPGGRTTGWSGLHNAISNKNIKFIKSVIPNILKGEAFELLSVRAKSNSPAATIGFTPLNMALWAVYMGIGSDEIANLLIDIARSEVDIKDAEDKIPLYYAIKAKKYDWAKKLIEKTNDENVQEVYKELGKINSETIKLFEESFSKNKKRIKLF